MFNKLIFFLDHQDKKHITYLLVLSIIIGLVEVAGVLSIMPFVGMITDPSYFASNTLSIYIKNYLSLDNRELTLLFGSFFIILFISSRVLSAFTLWLNARFSATLGGKISSRLYEHYLSQPYKFFPSKDLASLSKNIIQISVSLSESIIIPALYIITNAIILTLVSIILIRINTEAFIASSLLLILIYLIIFKNIKQKLTEYGKQRLKDNDALFKSTSDCLNSIKDVKFYRVEKFFKNSFEKSQKSFLDLTAKNIVISALPRYFIEVTAFGTLFTIILWMEYNNFDLSKSSPVIALFILAAYRILPIIQQIFAQAASIKFNLPGLDLIYNDMSIHVDCDQDNFIIKDIPEHIIYENIKFSFSDETLLANINFAVQKKSYNALIGASGSGKTTLVDLLLGLQKPTSGKIVISKDLYRPSNNSLKIGYVSQNTPFIDDSIKKNIAFGMDDKSINEHKIRKLIDVVILSDFINTLDEKIEMKIGDKGSKLSGGQLQRLAIARALYSDPNMLVFDEATNALDIKTEEELFKSLKINYPNITVICITHQLMTMKRCDTIYHLVDGEISTIYDSTNKINEDKLFELSNRYNVNEK